MLIPSSPKHTHSCGCRCVHYSTTALPNPPTAGEWHTATGRSPRLTWTVRADPAAAKTNNLFFAALAAAMALTNCSVSAASLLRSHSLCRAQALTGHMILRLPEQCSMVLRCFLRPRFAAKANSLSVPGAGSHVARGELLRLFGNAGAVPSCPPPARRKEFARSRKGGDFTDRQTDPSWATITQFVSVRYPARTTGTSGQGPFPAGSIGKKGLVQHSRRHGRPECWMAVGVNT